MVSTRKDKWLSLLVITTHCSKEFSIYSRHHLMQTLPWLGDCRFNHVYEEKSKGYDSVIFHLQNAQRI